MKIGKVAMYIVLFILCCLIVYSDQDTEKANPVLATTSWTAAFAISAGIDEIRLLAPYEMAHPPEYELKPSDIEAISHAPLIIYAGYENMIRRIIEAVDTEGDKLIQITTDHRLDTIRTSIMRIADIAGTQRKAEKNLAEIELLFQNWKQELAEYGLTGAPAIVHFFQRPLAEELGFHVVGVFGPTPLEAKQIVELSETNARLVIDNAHSPLAKPLRETMPESTQVMFINFPASYEQGSLLAVLTENRVNFTEVLLSGKIIQP